MNWKTRQMFSDREHGIVSGLSPVNMAGGGSVPWPSYQEGGTVPEEISIEQQVATLAAQQGISVPEARAMILNQMIQERGITLSEEIINQFATGLITLQDALAQTTEAGSGANTLEEKAKRGNIGIGVPYSSIDSNVLLEEAGPPMMQDGGLALDLFEEGDEEINEPLNIMAQATNPSIADITPTETVEETVTVTEDQGPTDVSALKEAFQELAVQAVQAANDAVEQGAPIEQVEGPLGERLMMIDEQYRQKSGTQDTILTEEFLAQLDTLSDISAEPLAMQDGGEVPKYDVETQKNVMRNKKEALIKRRRYFEELSKTALNQREKDRAAQAVKTLDKQIRKIDEEMGTAFGGAGPYEPTMRDILRSHWFGTDSPTVVEEVEEVEEVEVEAGKTGNNTGTGTTRKGEGRDPRIKTPTVDELTTQGFWEEMKANANRAKLGTLMSGKSKQGGIRGTMDVLGQSEVAGAEALGDAQDSMLAQLGASERTAAQLGKPPSSTWGERDWAAGSPIELEKAYRDIATKDGTPDADKFFIGKEIQPPPNIYPTLGTIDYNVIVVVNGKPMTFKEFYMLKRRERITDLIAIKREFDGLGPKKIYGSPQEAQEAGLKSGDQFYGPDGTLYEIP
jgi:hypothetical protein